MNEEIIFNRENICWFNLTTLRLLEMKRSRAMTTSSLRIMETSFWIILFGILLMFGNYSASKCIYCDGAVGKWRNIFIQFQQCRAGMNDEWNWKILMRVCEFFPEKFCWACGFYGKFNLVHIGNRLFYKNRRKVSSFPLYVVRDCHWSVL